MTRSSEHAGGFIAGGGSTLTIASSPGQEPPGARLVQIITSGMAARAVYVAAELGIADLLADGPKSVVEMAQETGTHSSSLHRLLRFLASLGIFAEEQSGRFELTPLAAPLCSDTPGSFRPMARFFGGPAGGQAVAGLLDSVRTGEAVIPRVYGMPMWEYLAQHREMAEVFNAHMTTQTERQIPAILDAYDFAGIETLVDVGGGHGVLLTAILRAYPSVRGIVYDQPEVAAGARAVLKAAGMTDRIQTVGGEFLTSVPVGGDAYMMKTVLHNWEDEQAAVILSNIRSVLDPGGKLLLLEHVILPGNAPQYGKLLDLLMLTLLGSRERTEAEYSALLAATGFQLKRIVPTEAGLSVIEATST